MKKVYLLNSISYYDDCSTILGCFMDYEKISKLVEDSEAYEKKYGELFLSIHNDLPFMAYNLTDFSFFIKDFYIEDEPSINLRDLSFKTNEELFDDIKKELLEEYPDRDNLFKLLYNKYDLNKLFSFLRSIIKSHPLNTVFENGFSSNEAVIEGLPTLYITETNLFF